MHHLYGHHAARRRLAKAISADRLPQVMLVVGAEGVGKQSLALWLAQLALCETAGAGPDGEPCGSCRHCVRVGALAHPDVHWMVPVPRPKASDQGKQVEEVADMLGEIMAERRKSGHWSTPDGMSSHGVASARLVLRRAALTPADGSRKVFIIGHAERLVPQESSPEAANALLKLLEEPPADTVLVLTTTDASRILPTIRSRAVPLRLGRLGDDEVEAFLERETDLPPGERRQVAARAGGCIGQALREQDEAEEKATNAARALLEAVTGESDVALFEQTLKQQPWSARGDFTAMLDALAARLSRGVRAAVSGGNGPKELRNRDAEGLLSALDHVQEARDLARGNVNPQLVLANLGQELSEAL